MFNLPYAGPPLSLSLYRAAGSAGQTQSGMFLWPAGEGLANFLALQFEDVVKEARKAHGQENGRMNVVELGCGVGLPALALAKIAKVEGVRLNILGTDRDANVLEVFRKNADLNELEVGAELINWGTKMLPSHSFDIILGADCIFIDEITKLLFFTVDDLLRKNEFAVFILATSLKMVDQANHISILEYCCNLYKLKRVVIKDEIQQGGIKIEVFSHTTNHD